MTCRQPRDISCGYLHLIKNTVHAQFRIVQDLTGSVDSLITHGLTRFVKQITQSPHEDKSGKKHNPQTESDGQ